MAETPTPDVVALVRRLYGEGAFVKEIVAQSGIKNLTDHPAFEGWPAWSPDGKRIAFAANRNSSYQIFVMNSDGTNVKLVANTEGRATAPKWSPDGRTIYFTNCWKTGLSSADEANLQKNRKDLELITGFLGDTVRVKLGSPRLETDARIIRDSPIVIKMHNFMPGAVIRYTLDGSSPDSAGQPFCLARWARAEASAVLPPLGRTRR